MTTIDEIRARHEAAIPGPWQWYGNTATDQVYLATRDRGRTYILGPDVIHTEYVYDCDNVESYTLEHARQNVLNFCGEHDERIDQYPDMPEKDESVLAWLKHAEREGYFDEQPVPDLCICDEIEEFLAGDIEREEGSRDYYRPEGTLHLTRTITAKPDFRFAVTPEGYEHTTLRSYRDHVRYEVLGYHGKREEWGGAMTKAQFEKETGKPVEEYLYREDFYGIDTPEADFIAHAREDIPFLLAEIDDLRADIDLLKTLGYQLPKEVRDAR
jgi:hypothetical protein